MTITKEIVTTFTEQDKETLRGMYKLVANINCRDVYNCYNCPFDTFCKICACVDNEEDFIKEIRDQIGNVE